MMIVVVLVVVMRMHGGDGGAVLGGPGGTGMLYCVCWPAGADIPAGLQRPMGVCRPACMSLPFGREKRMHYHKSDLKHKFTDTFLKIRTSKTISVNIYSDCRP